MNEKEIMHVGVLGMRWGKRRATQNANLERHGRSQPKNNLSKYKNLNDLRKTGAKNALKKDIADFDKHGMKDHADALRKNLAKMESPKVKKSFKEAMIKLADKKIKDFNDAVDSRTTAQKALVEAMYVIGSIATGVYIGSKVGEWLS